METVVAVYEKGVFRPLTNVNLEEHTQVRLQIIEQFNTDEIAEHPLLAFANLGRSGVGDISTRAEEILSEEIDPHRGWGKLNADHR